MFFGWKREDLIIFAILLPILQKRTIHNCKIFYEERYLGGLYSQNSWKFIRSARFASKQRTVDSKKMAGNSSAASELTPKTKKQ